MALEKHLNKGVIRIVHPMAAINPLLLLICVIKIS